MDGQTIFAILVGVALACFSLVMVGYSFFRNRDSRQEPQHPPATTEDDSVSVDSLFDAVTTLELEHQLGNVPNEQFQQQMQAYRRQIALALRERLHRGEASPDLVLEQEILRVRASGPGTWRSCPQCDAPLPVSQNSEFGGVSCPHCNASLAQASDNVGERSAPTVQRQEEDS